MSFISIEKISSQESWKIRGILFGFIILGLISFKFSPLEILHNLFPDFFLFKGKDSSCLMLNVFGIPCPFCGMSRAFAELMKFNFSMSMYYNPSSVIFFTFLAVASLSIFILSFFNYKISVQFDRKTFLFSALVLILMWTLNIFLGHH